ncbi:MAG: hypothetical protein K2M82_04025 [Lachnospiraceae bacterium]|nr:hypothetical protein [Lachnospiraceae bacterium]
MDIWEQLYIKANEQYKPQENMRIMADYENERLLLWKNLYQNGEERKDIRIRVSK